MNEHAPNPPISAKDICAIVVTYHPDSAFPDRLRQVRSQVRALVIVDNGSGSTALKMLHEVAVDPAITLVVNSANLGIAPALNIGIRRAAEFGFAWVLLLDQDSTIAGDMVPTLCAVSAAFPDPDRLALVGSGFYDINGAIDKLADPQIAPANAQAGNGAAVPFSGASDASGSAAVDPSRPDDRWEEAESAITSGSLISLKSFAAIGPFREEFFIDYVDTEYCFRARAKGYRVIRTRKAIMSHAIGAITRHSVLGINKWTFNHSADRRYYIARNDTVLLREYGHYRFGLWALKSLGRCVRLCKRIVLYERDKSAKIAAVAHGWWHGVHGQMGPRRPTPALAPNRHDDQGTV